MATNRKPVNFTGDENFRKGACHGATWFLQTTRVLISEGRSADEISKHLEELEGIMTEWRSGVGELPDGNPWDWSYRDLASVIKERGEK